MRPYFEKMHEFGSAVPAGKIKSGEANVKLIKGVGAELDVSLEKLKNTG